MRNQFARVIALVVPHLFEEFPEVERLGLLRQLVEYAPAGACSLAQDIEEPFQLRVHNSPEKSQRSLLRDFTTISPSLQSGLRSSTLETHKVEPPTWKADKKR